MRSHVIWSNQIHDKDSRCVYDVALSPDESMILIACGSKVFVYNSEGKHQESLTGHTDNVYCIGFAKDGQRFATGGADKQVIIWTSNLEGILRYSHYDAIQCVAYNPASDLLVSCACTDFGLWSPEQKNVNKNRVNARITSCSWTSDGLLLALGQANGCVSIRGRNGDEKFKIERTGASSSQVWGVCWSPLKDSNGEQLLAVVDWGQTLSFYNASGKQVGQERALGFDPLRVIYFFHGEYLVICGSNKQCVLYTNEGLFVGNVCEVDSWVWTCSSNLESPHLAIGCQDGLVIYLEIGFSTVHSLYRERYAYRENMTDVVIRHLITDEKAIVKCRELVKKIAVYEKRLAIQMPEHINIYTESDEAEEKMHYILKDTITLKTDCTLLVVCARHIILCQEKVLQCLSYQGMLEKEWIMDAPIRYIRAVGGPSGSETLLIGLRNGQVLKIFLNNSLPVNVLKIGSSIRCLDLSLMKKKLAVVDDNSVCSVYDINTKELLYKEPHANSVAWNTHFEDMLCFTGSGLLNIKVENYVVQPQKFQGFVIGFCGAKVFCLHYNSISTIDIPMSASMYQYIEEKIFNKAYQVACLGITESDWRYLAEAALQNLNFKVARQAYLRVKDFVFLKLIDNLQNHKKSESPDALLGYIYAYLGKYRLATNHFLKAKCKQSIFNMFIDMRLFKTASEYLEPGDFKEKKMILEKQAEWAINMNELGNAAEIYLSINQHEKAIELFAQMEEPNLLVDLAEKIDISEYKTLSLIARHLEDLKSYDNAYELYKRVDDIASLIRVCITLNNWSEAFELAEKYPAYSETVGIPYANFLIEHGEYLAASMAFQKIGFKDKALKLLEVIAKRAVDERRFQDASYYYWVMSQHAWRLYQEDGNEDDVKKNFEYRNFAAEFYYVYSFIYKYLEEPFTLQFSETLFNMSRYLMVELNRGITLPGISKFHIYYAAAKQSFNMKAYKLAHSTYNEAISLRIPERFRVAAELGSLHIKTKPFVDPENMLPMCYRCSTTNPFVNKNGNFCFNCEHPFIYSFISFEILPLVEFFLEDGISDEEAILLLNKVPPSPSHSSNESNKGDQLQLEADYEDRQEPYDIFNNFEDETEKIVLNRDQLEKMNITEVIIIPKKVPFPTRFFRNVMPNVQIKSCPMCNKFFHSDDIELEVLKINSCPFCRARLDCMEKLEEKEEEM